MLVRTRIKAITFMFLLSFTMIKLRLAVKAN